MAELGKYNLLEVLREVSIGYYLDGKKLGEILLPKNETFKKLKDGEVVEVFIYKDSEDRLIATCKKAFAQVGEFAFLEVVAKETIGAFLNWGLQKDLLLPYSEQQSPVDLKKKYLVYVYVDNSGRLAASSKVNKYLDKVEANYEVGDEVNAIIANKTDLGWNVIINNTHTGLIYDNEIFRKISHGEKLPLYIKRVREDGKLDLSLEKIGYESVADSSEIILAKIKENGGKIDITDKSSPEGIREAFGMSKKEFKRAVGRLYRERVIKIKEDSLILTINN